MKKLTRDERSWTKKLKQLEGEPKVEETEETKRENPTMENILLRVKNMIDTGKQLTPGQMAQVSKILNDEVVLRSQDRLDKKPHDRIILV